MCSPAAVAITGQSVGAAASLVGQGLQMKGQLDASKYQAAVAERNARLEEARAADAMYRGNLAAARARHEGHRVEAQQRAIAARSGVDPDVSSTGNVFLQTRANAGVAADFAKASAARAAWLHKRQAADLRHQADQVREAGVLGAVGTGLGMVGTVGGLVKGIAGSV